MSDLIKGEPEKRGINLLSDIKAAQWDDSLHDVTFICNDEKKITSNKFILATRSEYFAKLLFGAMREAGDSEIKMDTSEELLSAVITFCYTDKVPSLSLENAANIYGVGDYFQLEGMTKEAVTYIKHNLYGHPEGGDLAIKMLCEAVDQGQANLVDGPFVNNLRKFILSHRIISKDHLWQFSADALRTLLSDKKLATSGPTRTFPLFLAIVNWAWDIIAAERTMLTDRKAFFDYLESDDFRSGNFCILRTSDKEELEKLLVPILECIDYRTICPHRLAVIRNALPFLPHELFCDAFRDHCLDGSDPRHHDWCVGNLLHWTVSDNIHFLNGESTAEYKSTNPSPVLLCAPALPPTGTYKFTIAVKQIGVIPNGLAMNRGGFAVGLVAKAKFSDTATTLGLFSGSYGYLDSGDIYQNGQKKPSQPYKEGTYFQFVINTSMRTCTVLLKEKEVLTWDSFPSEISPAVTMSPGSICEIW